MEERTAKTFDEQTAIVREIVQNEILPALVAGEYSRDEGTPGWGATMYVATSAGCAAVRKHGNGWLCVDAIGALDFQFSHIGVDVHLPADWEMREWTGYDDED